MWTIYPVIRNIASQFIIFRKTHIYMLQFKTLPKAVKDIDMSGRVVTGYYSAFGNVDSDNDIVMPGAFTRTIQERCPNGKNRIMHLWQHDPWRPIGKPSVLREDEKGLYFETYFPDTTLGNDTLKLYEAGIINEHSIGFNVIKSEEKAEHTELTELMLWDGSSVTWRSNEGTPATGIKSVFKDETNIQTEINRIQKFLRKGDVTDETFQMLEYKLEQLKLIPLQEEQHEPSHEDPVAVLEALKTMNLKRDIRYGRFPKTGS